MIRLLSSMHPLCSVRPVIISRKLNKIDPHSYCGTLYKLAPLILVAHLDSAPGAPPPEIFLFQMRNMFSY